MGWKLARNAKLHVYISKISPVRQKKKQGCVV